MIKGTDLERLLAYQAKDIGLTNKINAIREDSNYVALYKSYQQDIQKINKLSDFLKDFKDEATSFEKKKIRDFDQIVKDEKVVDDILYDIDNIENLTEKEINEYEQSLQNIENNTKRYDKIIAEFDLVDNKKVEARKVLKDYENLKKSISTKLTDLNEYKSKYLAKECEPLERERDNINISPEVLDLYKKAKANGHNECVVKYDEMNGYCEGCNQYIEPEINPQMQKDKVLVCPRCQRILYV